MLPMSSPGAMAEMAHGVQAPQREQPRRVTVSTSRELACDISPTAADQEGHGLVEGLHWQPMDWRGIALVAVGGALGCVARYGVSTALATKGFPWATLAVNLVGSFAIG